MLTTILLAAALAGAPGAAAHPAPAQPAAAEAAPEPAASPQEAGALEASSLSEDDLASQAASLTATPDGPNANGEFAPAAQSGMALDQSRIENFTPPKPESPSIPSLRGIGAGSFSSAFGQ